MICFIVNVQSIDERFAYPLIGQIRRCFRDAMILVITDGYHSEPLKKVCLEFNSVYVKTHDRLRLLEYGGLWTNRFLTYFVSSNSNILIKIDPDSCLWRRFNQAFPIQDMFGTLKKVDEITYIRSAFIGIWRTAATRILESGILKDEHFKDQNLYGVLTNGEMLSKQDVILGVVANRLKLRLADWAEVDTQNTTYYPRNVNLTYAITSPHHTKPDG
jgi:hypothetical protein